MLGLLRHMSETVWYSILKPWLIMLKNNTPNIGPKQNHNRSLMWTRIFRFHSFHKAHTNCCFQGLAPPPPSHHLISSKNRALRHTEVYTNNLNPRKVASLMLRPTCCISTPDKQIYENFLLCLRFRGRHACTVVCVELGL